MSIGTTTFNEMFFETFLSYQCIPIGIRHLRNMCGSRLLSALRHVFRVIFSVIRWGRWQCLPWLTRQRPISRGWFQNKGVRNLSEAKPRGATTYGRWVTRLPYCSLVNEVSCLFLGTSQCLKSVCNTFKRLNLLQCNLKVSHWVSISISCKGTPRLREESVCKQIDGSWMRHTRSRKAHSASAGYEKVCQNIVLPKFYLTSFHALLIVATTHGRPELGPSHSCLFLRHVRLE